MAKKQGHCDFCGRSSSEVSALVPGPSSAICEDCARQIVKLIDQYKGIDSKPKTELQPLKTPSPQEIKEFLDRYVIGQDETKKILAVAVHNHYRRLECAERKAEKNGRNSGKANDKKANPSDEVEIEKSNILLLGSTGSGKTLLARTLAKMLGVPFAIGDATVLTQAGYVGEDVENLVRYLLQNANGDVELAKRGIIYVDEIDKLASKTDNVSITRDVGGEGVQQALLKIIEGTICRIPPKGGRKHPDQEYIEVDTSNILFICGGAFVGLDKIIRQRCGRSVIGFGDIVENAAGKRVEKLEEITLSDVHPEDLISFGLIPEFIGRLPVITAMKDLTEDDLVRILTEPKNSLVRQYTQLLAMDDVTLEFTQEALRKLAQYAIERKTGARGLRAGMEKLMLDIMYEAPSRGKSCKVVVTEDMVKERLG